MTRNPKKKISQKNIPIPIVPIRYKLNSVPVMILANLKTLQPQQTVWPIDNIFIKCTCFYG